METWIASVTALLTSPAYGLGGLFVASFVSATLLPLGSEVLLLALLRTEPGLWWPAVAVATVGNTLGGAFTWWMGRGAGLAAERLARRSAGNGSAAPAAVVESPARARSRRWLERHGPAACVLAWLPVVGDPLCAVAGWLRLPFWPCVIAMGIGKFLRYATLSALAMGF